CVSVSMQFSPAFAFCMMSFKEIYDFYRKMHANGTPPHPSNDVGDEYDDDIMLEDDENEEFNEDDMIEIVDDDNDMGNMADDEDDDDMGPSVIGPGLEGFDGQH